MNRLIVFISFIFIFSVSFYSCNAISNLLTEDETPPEGYRPNFVRNIAKIAPKRVKDSSTTLDIFRIDARDPNSIKIYLQLIDTAGNYLTGAATKEWRNYWCEITEEFEGQTYQIKKFNLKEYNDKTSGSHAFSFVLDHSGSMGEKRAKMMQDFTEVFINKKDDNDEIGIVKFDHNVKTEVPITSSSTVARSKFKKNSLEGFGGSTALYSGIAQGLQELNNVSKKKSKVAVIFTDGYENSSTITKEQVIDSARRSGATVNTLGFGSSIDSEFLKELASVTGGKYRRMYMTSEFSDVFSDLYYRTKNYYLMDYIPQNFGYHKVKIKLCLPNDTLYAEGEYDNTPYSGDIVILNINFDVNKSIIKPEYSYIVDNIYQLMKRFPNMTGEIQGHTDITNNSKDPDFNKKLSQKRADAVKDAIIKKGIAKERLTAIGYGESKPISDNDTDEGKALNRRTEFIVISK